MKIDCEQLFSLPQYTQVRLSHNGRSVFYICIKSGKRVLYKFNLDNGTEEVVSKIRDEIKLFNVLDDDNFYYLTEENGYLNTLYINIQNRQYRTSFEDSNLKVLNYSFELNDPPKMVHRSTIPSTC